LFGLPGEDAVNKLKRLLGLEPPDPADLMIEWLKGRSLNDRRLILGNLFGGPYSTRVCKWILATPDCDKGSASMALWNFASPDGVLRAQGFAVDLECARGLLEFIVKRWRDGLFVPAAFGWDSREGAKRYRRELKKQGIPLDREPFGIPEEAWLPIKGPEPIWSDETATNRPSRMNDIRHLLRLYDLAAANPKEWEAIRRKTIGLD
jgi:hypothetical protein